MHKFKKYTVMLMLAAFAVCSPYKTVNAEPSENPPEEQTEETDEGDEETVSDAGGSWKHNETENIWTYELNQQPVKGWNKIDGYWYYFDGNGKMQTNTTIGIYNIDEEGHLTNGDTSETFVPAPHGQIFNSSTMTILKDGHEQAENVTTKINDIYDRYKNGQPLDITEIKEIRYLYNSLLLSEKARVNNESKLAELENSHGIVYDYDTIYATSSDATEADGDVKKGNSYVFEISDNQSTITVITRFTSDTDMDGINDIPVIQLVTPQGEVMDITNDAPQIRNTSINASFTWTENFMQIDIASAENGKWTIMTDIVCTFTSQEYSGNRQDINPIPSEDETHSITDPTKEPAEEKKKEGNNTVLLLVILVLTVGGFIALMIIVKRTPMGKDKEKSSKNSPAPQPAMTKEEELAMLKKELAAMDADYTDNYDALPEQPVQQQTYDTQTTFSQEEINESLEEYSYNASMSPSDHENYNAYNTENNQNLPVENNYNTPEPPQFTDNNYSQEVYSPANEAAMDDWYEEEE